MKKYSGIEEVYKTFESYIGFSTNIFDNPEEIFPLIEKIGVDFKVIEVEFENTMKNIFNYNVLEINQWIDKLLKIKERNSLYFSVHGPYVGNSTDISSSNNEIRHHAVQVMKKSIKISHALGATIFTCHPGYLDKSIEFEKKVMNNLNHSLDELVPYAEQLGITISLENTGNHRPRYIVLDYEKHQQLCEDHGIGITLDLIHYTTFNPMNDDYYSGLKRMIPYVKNVHFSDMKIPYHAHLPLGEGNFSYHDVLGFLYGNGYRGNAIIEETGTRYSPELYFANGMQYKKFLKSSEADKVVL